MIYGIESQLTLAFVDKFQLFYFLVSVFDI